MLPMSFCSSLLALEQVYKYIFAAIKCYNLLSYNELSFT